MKFSALLFIFTITFSLFTITLARVCEPCSLFHLKNSLFAGYYRDLPGFPRYSVLGSDESGVFNLQITAASLEDEAVYECQVGPNGTNKPIRANAKLNVLCKLLSS